MAAITITNAGLNLMRDGMSGAQSPIVTYVSLGTGSTAPAVTDTSLQVEVYRKKVTSYANGSTGELFVNLYLAPGDTVGTAIAEVGFWGGNASNTPNSGVLLARGLYSHTKTGIESIQFQLDLTV